MCAASSRNLNSGFVENGSAHCSVQSNCAESSGR